MENKIFFSWGNYLKPTPLNLQRITTTIRRIIAGIAGTSVIVESDKWITFCILFIGVVLDELSNFFDVIVKDTNEQVVIKYPKEIADQISVSVEDVPKEQEDGKNGESK